MRQFIRYGLVILTVLFGTAAGVFAHLSIGIQYDSVEFFTMEKFPLEFRPPLKQLNTGLTLTPAPSSLFSQPRHIDAENRTQHATCAHVGVDLPVANGTPVYPSIAPSETTPVYILQNVVYDYGGPCCRVCYDLNGNGVIDFPSGADLADARMYTRYMHLTTFGKETPQGTVLKSDKMIGTTGSNHLHWDVCVGTESDYQHADPASFFSKDNPYYEWAQSCSYIRKLCLKEEEKLDGTKAPVVYVNVGSPSRVVQFVSLYYRHAPKNGEAAPQWVGHEMVNAGGTLYKYEIPASDRNGKFQYFVVAKAKLMDGPVVVDHPYPYAFYPLKYNHPRLPEDPLSTGYEYAYQEKTFGPEIIITKEGYPQSPTIRYIVTDSLLKSVQVTLDGTKTEILVSEGQTKVENTIPFEPTQVGPHKITVTAQDQTNNETENWLDFVIDPKPDVKITVRPTDDYSATAIIDFEVIDSNLKSVTFRKDNEPEATVDLAGKLMIKQSVTFDGFGTHKLVVHAVDAEGRESTGEGSVEIKHLPRLASFEPGLYEKIDKGPVNIAFVMEDAGGDLTNVIFAVTGPDGPHQTLVEYPNIGSKALGTCEVKVPGRYDVTIQGFHRAVFLPALFGIRSL